MKSFPKNNQLMIESKNQSINNQSKVADTHQFEITSNHLSIKSVNNIQLSIKLNEIRMKQTSVKSPNQTKQTKERMTNTKEQSINQSINQRGKNSKWEKRTYNELQITHNWLSIRSIDRSIENQNSIQKRTKNRLKGFEEKPKEIKSNFNWIPINQSMINTTIIYWESKFNSKTNQISNETNEKSKERKKTKRRRRWEVEWKAQPIDFLSFVRCLFV